jgi:hypothetical protein
MHGIGSGAKKREPRVKPRMRAAVKAGLGAEMDKTSVEFHLAEYTALRSELQTHARSSVEAVLYSLLANAAIVAWISSLNIGEGKLTGFVIVAACIPAVLTFLAWGIFRQRYRSVMLIAEYCRLLETKFAAEGLGWETFASKSKSNWVIRSRHYHMASFIVQILLSVYLIVSTLLALR